MINSRLANPASAYTQSYAPYNLRPRLPSVFRSISVTLEIISFVVSGFMMLV